MPRASVVGHGADGADGAARLAGQAGQPGRACEQSSDAKPMSHWHVPLKHVPCPVQLEGHSPRTPAQSSPKKPTSHKQLKLTLAPARPAAHSPWP